MHRQFVAAVALIFTVAIDSAALAQSTCSGMRDRCVAMTAGRSLRGVGGAACHTTYESCMRTGVWDARPYPYGILKTGLQKR